MNNIELWQKAVDAEQKRIAAFLKTLRSSSGVTGIGKLSDNELEKIAGGLAVFVYPPPLEIYQKGPKR
ncbi:MAG: hypothetical protein PHU95_03585 [Candidatus Thermoplasmatota archaeon]|nr:hypothetical protein [Candidatus Thermoplasmatota archaeon]MDD5778510.1 hypothetical protein [Candidatus Thermoplasmatota archaeon]